MGGLEYSNVRSSERNDDCTSSVFHVLIPTAQRREIGSLPNLDHGISGTLYAEGDRTFVIENFSYDGNAPEVFVYVFERETSNGLIIRLPDVGTR